MARRSTSTSISSAGCCSWCRSIRIPARRGNSTRRKALARGDKEADAVKIFDAIAQEGGGYAVLASFEEAAELAKSGDRKAAIAIYDRIAATSELDSSLRELAVLLSVMQSMPESDPRQTIERLAPLTARGNSWRPTALELTALARFGSGDKSGALDLYKSLADDLTAPPGLRARAAEMAAALAS